MNACRAVFPFITAVQQGRFILSLSTPICSQLHRAASAISRSPFTGALNRLNRGPAAGENRELPPQSIVGSFCLQPRLEFVVDSVAPDGCPLALAAAQASLAARYEGGQNDSTRATTRDRPRGVGTAEQWPRYVLRVLPRASRTVRFTRSMKAVLSRPERPSRGLAPLRAASVPSPITGVTRTSLRRR